MSNLLLNYVSSFKHTLSAHLEIIYALLISAVKTSNPLVKSEINNRWTDSLDTTNAYTGII